MADLSMNPRDQKHTEVGSVSSLRQVPEAVRQAPTMDVKSMDCGLMPPKNTFPTASNAFKMCELRDHRSRRLEQSSGALYHSGN